MLTSVGREEGGGGGGGEGERERERKYLESLADPWHPFLSSNQHFANVTMLGVR